MLRDSAARANTDHLESTGTFDAYPNFRRAYVEATLLTWPTTVLAKLTSLLELRPGWDILAWISTSTSSEPTHSMIVAGAGAVGAMVGAAMLQARTRTEERRRAMAVLRISLRELSTLLESDARMIATPLANHEGNLVWNSNLIAYTGRAKQTCQQIATTAVPVALFNDGLNEALAKLRTAGSSMATVMDDANSAARTNPQTVEEFFIALGPSGKDLKLGADNVCKLITAVEAKT